MNVIARVTRSIFFKLVLVFIVTAVVMAMAVGSIVRYAADERPYGGMIKRNMAQYAGYLMREIGRPPDLVKAQELADGLNFHLRISSPEFEWSSRPGFEPRIPREFRGVPGFPGVRSAHHRGRIAVESGEPGLRYLFLFGRQGRPGGFDGELVLLVILVVGLILALSYLTVRWLFRPLGWLTSGMQKMGRGDLDARIPVRKHDELGELASTFNEMSDRIREQVKAKQQLLRDVSHELRSPMTRMKVAAEFIEDEKIRQRITADLDEMEAMTGEILESERLTSEQGGLNMERVDLARLVSDLVSTYSDTRPGVETAANGPAPVNADPERVRALLRNLIDNAIKYSDRQPNPVSVTLESQPQHVLVTVEDYGDGIPEGDLALIFEPFYRVDKSRHRATGGYGLGLSLCRKIMEAHGGSLEVQSKVGEGTRFTARFPAPGGTVD